jgi:hypothetical protein
MPFPVCGICKAGANVFLGQIVIIIQNFLFRHSGGKAVEDVIHSNSQTSNAGFSASFAWFYRDDVLVWSRHEQTSLSGINAANKNFEMPKILTSGNDIISCSFQRAMPVN